MNTIYKAQQNQIQYTTPSEHNRFPVNRRTEGFGQRHKDKLGFKSYYLLPPPIQGSNSLVDLVTETIIAIFPARPEKLKDVECQIKRFEQIERDIQREREQKTQQGNSLDQLV